MIVIDAYFADGGAFGCEHAQLWIARFVERRVHLMAAMRDHHDRGRVFQGGDDTCRGKCLERLNAKHFRIVAEEGALA